MCVHVYKYTHMKTRENHKSQSLSCPHIAPSLLKEFMMTSSHQSHTTSFKPPRMKKPPHQISRMGPSPAAQPVLKCPRCDSVNTKFCYYNNYSLSQPRHYCKNCRRYWTRGGSLRNVPVGGLTRNKNKPSSLQVISSPPPIVASHMNTAMVDPLSSAFSGGFSGYMFPLDPNYNLASSSIESLSSLNQDLHQKLQQQRLITSMFQQDSPAVMFHNVEILTPSTATTEWAFDRSVMGGAAACGSNESTGEREGNLGSWFHNPNNSMP